MSRRPHAEWTLGPLLAVSGIIAPLIAFVVTAIAWDAAGTAGSGRADWGVVFLVAGVAGIITYVAARLLRSPTPIRWMLGSALVAVFALLFLAFLVFWGTGPFEGMAD